MIDESAFQKEMTGDNKLTPFEEVGLFHQKFNLPTTNEGRVAKLMDMETAEYRTKFMEEELQEFKDALIAGNLLDAADALVDLCWVAMGTAHYMGLPFDELWAEVKRANMAKCLGSQMPGGAPDHKRGRVEKISKPEGWVPPDIHGIIVGYNRKAKLAPPAEDYFEDLSNIDIDNNPRILP